MPKASQADRMTRQRDAEKSAFEKNLSRLMALAHSGQQECDTDEWGAQIQSNRLVKGKQPYTAKELAHTMQAKTNVAKDSGKKVLWAVDLCFCLTFSFLLLLYAQYLHLYYVFLKHFL